MGMIAERHRGDARANEIRFAAAMNTDHIQAIISRECARVSAFLGEDEGLGSALLPILNAIQAEFGFIDKENLPLIADALNVSQAEIRGVVSFYHDYRLEPSGRHILKLCRAEACQSMGCEKLAAHIEHQHALRPGESFPDGSLTLQNVYCLGNCALAPAAMLNDDLIGRIDEQRIDAIIAGARR